MKFLVFVVVLANGTQFEFAINKEFFLITNLTVGPLKEVQLQYQLIDFTDEKEYEIDWKMNVTTHSFSINDHNSKSWQYGEEYLNYSSLHSQEKLFGFESVTYKVLIERNLSNLSSENSVESEHLMTFCKITELEEYLIDDRFLKLLHPIFQDGWPEGFHICVRNTLVPSGISRIDLVRVEDILIKELSIDAILEMCEQ